MERLFKELGGKVHTNTEVSEILVEGSKVTGLRLADGSIHRADVIVSNADVAWTYQNLIPSRYRRRNSDRRYKNMRYSMSLFVIYFGTRRRYVDSKLAHHNIILGPRYKGLLDDIFGRKDLAEDFSLYLHMPTITDPSLAPPDHEAFYVLSPVPHLGSGIDWNVMARPYRDRIMEFLEQNYLPDLRPIL
jgi:phytoene desaturase